MSERDLQLLPGIGESISRRIREYLETGHIRLMEQMGHAMPQDFALFTRIPGVGTRTAERFKTDLGVDTVQDLAHAAEEGRVARVFGDKLAERVTAALPELEHAEPPRWLLYRALPLAKRIRDRLAGHPAVARAMFAGSVRRGAPTAGDLDFVAAVADPDAVAHVGGFFAGFPEVQHVYAIGGTPRVRLAGGIDAELTVVHRDAWGAALALATGSRDHAQGLRRRAEARGLLVNAHGVHRVDAHGQPAERVAGATEEDVYAALGLPTVPPPELREGRGELEASERGALPHLVTLRDVKGDCHTHTDASDGTATVNAMADAARDAGREWLAVTDHTAGLPVARGKPAAFFEDRLASVHATEWPIPVLVGAEVNITPEGGLDLPDAVLERLDVVVASVHHQLRMDAARMTERLVNAISTGLVDILGHPTNRRMPERGPSDFDFRRVVEAAVDHDVALEVDGAPERLDLDGKLSQEAKEMGAKFSIDSDAHSQSEIAHSMALGVVTARRGWLTPADVVTTWPVDTFREWVRDRRRA